jgi:hypothetical protein
MDADPTSIQVYVKPVFELECLTYVRTRGTDTLISLDGALFASTGSYCTVLFHCTVQPHRSAVFSSGINKSQRIRT